MKINDKKMQTVVNNYKTIKRAKMNVPTSPPFKEEDLLHIMASQRQMTSLSSFPRRLTFMQRPFCGSGSKLSLYHFNWEQPRIVLPSSSVPAIKIVDFQYIVIL